VRTTVGGDGVSIQLITTISNTFYNLAKRPHDYHEDIKYAYLLT